MALSDATLELLGWISSGKGSYPEVMEAWRSTCPFHATWDDAVADGLIQVDKAGVTLSAAGQAALVAG